jgi:hypothetical protein
VPVATLTYQLPDDDDEFQLAANARRLLIAIEHADQACRAVIKYHEQPSEDAVRLAEKVRRILAEEAGDLLY